MVEWAAGVFDHVVVAVLANPDKPSGLYRPDERARLAGLATAHLDNVRCLSYAGTTGALVQREGADVILRSDHKEPEMERSLAVLNRFMSGGAPTVYAPDLPGTAHISSTAVRSLVGARRYEEARALLPPAVGAELETAGRLESPQGRPMSSSGVGPMTLGRRVPTFAATAVEGHSDELDLDSALDLALTLVEAAAASGAKLVVLPEAFIPGYPAWVWDIAASGDDIDRRYADLYDNCVVVGSSTTQVLALAAERFGIYLSIGVNERAHPGSTIYSSQILYGPAGDVLSVHRKVVTTGPETLVWGVGDGTGMKTIDTPYGRFATLIGWEMRMPLARAALYQQGVDVLIGPCATMNAEWASGLGHIAREGGVHIVGAGLDAAMIVGADGSHLSGAFEPRSGHFASATVDANQARHARLTFDPAGRHSRPDLFELTVSEKAPAVAPTTETGPAGRPSSA